MTNIKELKALTKNFTILYVEDEEELRVSVVNYLERIFKTIIIAKDGLEGLELYKKQDFDIVITDIHMPNMNGLEMAKKIKELNSKQDIVIISAYTEIHYFIESIKLGISGYIIKPIDSKQMNEEFYKIAYKLKQFRENELYNDHLEELITQKTQEKENLQLQIIQNYEQTLFALVDMIEKRDTYTGGHSQRVAEYSVLIGKEIGCRKEECDKLYQAGILHDIGKISTPDSILLKPGRLNKIEYKLIQEHAMSGYDILKKIYMYKDLAEIILSHHERYDGKGYPFGLKQDHIPFLSRIMTVADAFDAMTTNRIYKKRKEVDAALQEIKELAGVQFDPDIANAACVALKDVTIKQNTDQLPSNDLERERFSYFYKDQVVEAYNKNYLALILSKNNYEKEYRCLNAFLFNGLTEYGEKNGWEKMDELLSDFVLYAKQKYPQALIFRVNGDDFILLHNQCLEITDDFLQEMDIINNNDIIKVTRKHIDLNTNSISSLESLQKSICIFDD